jgi:hypothetical protein
VSKIPSFIPPKGKWTRKQTHFRNVLQLWKGDVVFTRALACEALQCVGRNDELDRKTVGKRIANMMRDIEDQLFLDSAVTIRFAVCNWMENKPLVRIDGAHCLTMIAEHDLPRDLEFAVQLLECDTEDQFADVMVATEFRGQRSDSELTRTLFGKNAAGLKNAKAIKNGYSLYCKALRYEKDGTPMENDKKHFSIDLKGRPDVVSEISKHIGRVGDKTMEHIHGSNPMALLCWIYDNHPKDLKKFANLISVGGGKAGCAALAYRDLLLRSKIKKTRGEVNMVAQRFTRHEYGLNAGMYAYTLWKMRHADVSYANLENYMTYIGDKSSRNLEKELNENIAKKKSPKFFLKKPSHRSVLKLLESK